MTEYPTVEEWNEARKLGLIYCKRINEGLYSKRIDECNVYYCCWFCSGLRDNCPKKCPREYWQVCNERCGWEEITWSAIFGEPIPRYEAIGDDC